MFSILRDVVHVVQNLAICNFLFSFFVSNFAYCIFFPTLPASLLEALPVVPGLNPLEVWTSWRPRTWKTNIFYVEICWFYKFGHINTNIYPNNMLTHPNNKKHKQTYVNLEVINYIPGVTYKYISSGSTSYSCSVLPETLNN